MALTFSVGLLSLLFNVVLAASSDLKFDVFSDIEEYDDTQFAQTSFSSLLVKCDSSVGVCIQADSCPWDRMLVDDENRCLLMQTNYVCCKTAQVRMPLNFFAAYGM